jgi:hypothetical protein
MILLLLVAGVHRGALQGGWRFDDSYQLIFSGELTSWNLLFDPTSWREFNSYFFTPGLALAYKFDQWLFGRVPAAFYAHVLFSLWLLLWLTFAVLRRFIGTGWALAASVLFLLSAPVASIVNFLPARHYIEGMCFALLAVACHLRGQQSGRYRWFAGAVAFYLMATLFKEVFAPLVLPLLVMSVFPTDGAQLSRRDRIAIAGSYVVAAFVYLVWRSLMLGSVIGGFSNSLGGIWLLPLAAAHLPWPILGGAGITSILTLTLLTFVLARVALRQPRQLWMASACVVAVIAPLAALPELASEPSTPVFYFEFRFFILPAWLLCAGSAWILSQLQGKERYLAGAAVVVLATSVMQQTSDYSHTLQEQLTFYDTQARFVETHTGDALIVTDRWADWILMHSLLRIRQDANPAPALIIAKRELDRAIAEHKRIWAYDYECRCMVQVSGTLLQKNRNQYRFFSGSDAPLALFFRMQKKERNASWDFEPGAGTISVLFPGPVYYLSTPKVGQARLVNSFKTITLVRSNHDEYLETEPIPLPETGTVVWHKGVFVEPRLMEGFDGTLQEGGRCGIRVFGSNSATAISVDHGQPVEVLGWISGAASDDFLSRDVAVALSQNGIVKYSAFLYRDTERDGESSPAHKTVSGFSIRDADLTRVVPSSYEIDFIRRNREGGLAHCKTGRKLEVL